MDDIALQLQESIDTKKALLSADVDIIRKIADIVVKAFRNNHRIYLIGNGGSAADAQHIAGELIGRFKMNRRPLPAVALTTDTSVMTALANDFGYDTCFARQVEALAVPGDVLLAFSTSGNPKVILNAVQIARDIGVTTVGFTGRDGGLLKDAVNICLKIPSNNTPRIQECHITVGHIVCAIVEKELFGDCNKVKKRKAVFLDRDGTIIVHEPYLSSPDQLKLLPNAVEGIRLFKEHGYLIIVVTNQSGVARGFFDEEHLVLIHKKLLRMLKDEGVEIDDIYYCPHHLEGIVEEYRVACDCRKPRPKMLLDAARQHRIDLTQSLMIGDSVVDMQAGKNAGCKCVLIKNSCGDAAADTTNGKNPDFIATDLLDAARLSMG